MYVFRVVCTALLARLQESGLLVCFAAAPERCCSCQLPDCEMPRHSASVLYLCVVRGMSSFSYLRVVVRMYKNVDGNMRVTKCAIV